MAQFQLEAAIQSQLLHLAIFPGNQARQCCRLHSLDTPYKMNCKLIQGGLAWSKINSFENVLPQVLLIAVGQWLFEHVSPLRVLALVFLSQVFSPSVHDSLLESEGRL